jgi:hypothetical protein
MASPLDFVPSSSCAADKGKGPADKAVYLPDLPLDIRKLITPYLVDHNLNEVARNHNKANLSKTTKDFSWCPLVNQCRNNIERVRLYREIALDRGELLDDPENLGEILKYSTTYDSIIARNVTKMCLVKGLFTVNVTPSAFAYSDDAAAKLSPSWTKRKQLNCDGYRVTLDPPTGNLFISCHISKRHTEIYIIHGGLAQFRDMALAPMGILFVATDSDLKIYDLNTSKTSASGRRAVGATLLHQLPHRFDTITWNEKRARLIGEKEGVVSELGVYAISTETSKAIGIPDALKIPGAVDIPSALKTPDTYEISDDIIIPLKAKPRMSSIAKMGYVAKRILKIIVVEGPENAFKGTKKGFELLSLSKRKLIVTVGLGALGVGLFAAGFALCVLAPPIFGLLAVPACTIGGGLIAWAIRPLILPSVFGTITGIFETFRSLDDLHGEVFSI